MDSTELARRLGATTVFSRLPRDGLLALLERSPRRRLRAGDWLAEPDAGHDSHLVLVSGACEARRIWQDADGTPRSFSWRIEVGNDGPGFALLGPAGRNVGVQALTDCEGLLLDADELEELLGWEDLGGHARLARRLKVFHKVSPDKIQRAFERMREREVSSGETIVRQGDPGDGYYIILSGEADVLVTDPLTDETTLATVLSDGDGFGEEALLLDGSRTATVRMNTPGRLLVLSKSDFDELLEPEMVETVDAARAHELLQAGRAKLVDCRYEMEFEESRIPGATLVPLDKLRRQGVFTIDPDTVHIVYCRSGRRSKAAAFLLRERGIRAMSLTGGIRDWPYAVDDTPP